MDNFTHLHLHTQYSLLDGVVLIPALVEQLKEYKMTACAITDHGWMAGVIDFYKALKKVGIKPLIGVEAYITYDQDDLENSQKQRDNMHMILIAKDNTGYSRLLELVSQAAMHNFYYKPRICIEHLKYLGGHVVATSACLAGVTSKSLAWNKSEYNVAISVEDKYGLAHANIERFRQIFGEDFLLELQVWDDGNHHQQVYNEWLLDYGREHGIPFILTSDAHYLKLEDHKLHELLMAMQLKLTLEEYRQLPEMQYGPYFYLADQAEMWKRAESVNCLEAYNNTNLIAERCNVEIQLGKYQVPVYKIEEAEDYREFLEWEKKQNG